METGGGWWLVIRKGGGVEETKIFRKRGWVGWVVINVLC